MKQSYSSNWGVIIIISKVDKLNILFDYNRHFVHITYGSSAGIGGTYEMCYDDTIFHFSFLKLNNKVVILINLFTFCIVGHHVFEQFGGLKDDVCALVSKGIRGLWLLNHRKTL